MKNYYKRAQYSNAAELFTVKNSLHYPKTTDKYPLHHRKARFSLSTRHHSVSLHPVISLASRLVLMCQISANGITNKFFNRFRQFFQGYIFTYTYIEEFFIIIVIHQNTDASAISSTCRNSRFGIPFPILLLPAGY